MESISVLRASWIAQVKSWRDSDLRQADYPRRHALNAKTFPPWIKRSNTSINPIAVLPVTLVLVTAAKDLLLRHASGWQLAFPSAIRLPLV
jgi:hypothetical protein